MGRKILIVTEVFYPETFIVNDLATELVARGHNVSVMTRQPSYPEGKVYRGYTNDVHSEEEWRGVHIHRFKTIEGYKSSKLKKILNYCHYVVAGKKLICSLARDADVILVHQTGPLTVAFPAVFAKKKFNVPVVVWTFDIWPDAVYMYGFPKVPPLTMIVDGIIKKVYRSADRILVSSKAFSDTILQYAPDKEVVYAPNWMIETIDEKSPVRLPEGKVNFTFTGNISKAQNLENVIRGFAEAAIDDAVLNIVGNGSSLDDLKELVINLGIRNVLFYGRRPYPEMQDILAQSDFVVLSLVSNSGIDKTEPLKLQSYLKSGKPIFGVLKGAGRDIISENGLGVCSDPDNPADIAGGFKVIMGIGEKEKLEIKQKSSSLMSMRFNREVVISRIEGILRSVWTMR